MLETLLALLFVVLPFVALVWLQLEIVYDFGNERWLILDLIRWARRSRS